MESVEAVVDARLWYHCTGISPLVSSHAYSNWDESLQHARMHGIPVSFDLNHRPALGKLDSLWSKVSPHIASFKLVVLAQSNVTSLVKLLGVEEDVAADLALQSSVCESEEDKCVVMMKHIHAALRGPIIACCFKHRDTVQRRWSVAVDAKGTHSTYQTSVYHLPKDECGGGSAWSSAVIDALNSGAVKLVSTPNGLAAEFVGVSNLGGPSIDCLASVCRRGDVLAALCQEEVGDHSTTTRAELNHCLLACEGQHAYIGNVTHALVHPHTHAHAHARSSGSGGGAGAEDGAGSQPPTPVVDSAESAPSGPLSTQSSPSRPPPAPAPAHALTRARSLTSPVSPLLVASPTSPVLGVPVMEGAEEALAITHAGIKQAVVVAILRTNNRAVAFSRGCALVSLGCRALEVTVDSEGFVGLVQDLVRAVGHVAVVGAGTVTNRAEVELAARAGCRFAMSPIHPTDGFVAACHAHGMLAIPAAYTPQEVSACFTAGARMCKLFPATMWTPQNLRALRAVGMFGKFDILPSGGISPDNVGAWLSAGACAVGMGSCLVGDDVRLANPTPEALVEAGRAWEESGAAVAAALFKRVLEGPFKQ